MILRVYAMYNRSRIILGVLLVIYIAQVVIFVVTCSIYSDPNYATGTYRAMFTAPSRNFAFSVNCSIARYHHLQCHSQYTDVEYCTRDHPVRSRHRHVHLGDSQVREGLAPDAPSDTEMAFKQISESSHQRRYCIFPRVRPPFFCRHNESTEQHTIAPSPLVSSICYFFWVP